MKSALVISAGLALCFAGATAKHISHPALLATPQRVAAAEKACVNDTARAADRAELLRLADEQAAREHADVRRLEYPALAWQLTGGRKYADVLKRTLRQVAETESWGDREMLARNPAWRSELQMAHRAFQLALAYDAVCNDLSARERKDIARGLWRLAGEPLLGDWILEPTRIHSLNSMGHNWWTSCVCMGGLLGLAIGNEVPEAYEAAAKVADSLPEWFDFAGDMLQHKPQTFDRDGGMYESINYASFGNMEAMLFRQAWLNAHPGAKLEKIDQMEKLASFFAHVSYPRTGELYSLNFGDSHKPTVGDGPVMLAYAMGAEDPTALWYETQLAPRQRSEGFHRAGAVNFLYTPDLSKAPATPDLPTSHLWKDFGWATMRDSWEKDATMLAVKSGMTWNHSHADANSMILFHKGVDIIKDAGNCSYGKPEYRGYFFQSPAHNVVLFNGEGQKTYQQYHGTMLPGSVGSLTDGRHAKYVVADGTGPMSHALDRNYRSWLWIDDVILVIDDMHAHEPGKFTWLWHPNGEARKNGFDLEITNGDAAVNIRPLYPRPLAYSNYVHDYPEDMWWEEVEAPHESLQSTEKYWAFHLPGETDRVKGVTAIILKDSAGQRELPRIERREGKDWLGLRVTSAEPGADGRCKVTDIYINQLADGRLMHLNSWIDADGWSTDAYLLAVSYPEGSAPETSDEIFIGHGSALRRAGDVWFSSLSKLNVAASKSDITVNGQPRINCRIRTASTPLQTIRRHDD